MTVGVACVGDLPSIRTGPHTLGELAEGVERLALVTTNGDATTPGVEVTGGGYFRLGLSWGYVNTGIGRARSRSGPNRVISNMPACELQGWEAGAPTV